ncbi:MAG: AbrB/MazE/SpoVT family DNA-binding domain-containing protein [Acidobacteria bacterium]|nr:AbrB/MazE/SpoVT family DNA-binding domain-containing protein [Acidobacteriota bacterium]MCL5287542.1 AbrB/MazE/SpoVT family DNA-binding domain-containing protein [Acidobacteriota bacterium]
MPPRAAGRIRVGAKRQVTLPREVTRKLRLNEGDDLELRVQDGRIELVPLALIPRDQLWFWTPEWQAKEREADEDKAAGRVKRFKSAKALIASLKK